MNRQRFLNIAAMTAVGFAMALWGSAVAQHAGEHKLISATGHQMGTGATLRAPGAQAAVSMATGQGGHVRFRLKMPKGYHIAPHTHPKPEIVTVLSGTARLGMGTTADRDKAQVLPRAASSR